MMDAAIDATPAGPAPGSDLSALTWVHGELRKSLETAHKALRRYLKEAEAQGGSDVDAVDPAVLRTARVHIHQGVGALELVGLPAPAQLLRASEAAVQRMAAKPAMVNVAAVEAVEKASFALIDYLGRMLAGKPVSPVALFPQYRAVQALAGADRVHPADLWLNDWHWQELPPEPTAQPRAAADETRSAMEALVLALMRRPDRHLLMHMSDLCAGLAAGATHGSGSKGRLATLWQLAAAFFEAQSQGLLASDVYGKRVASRLLAQLRTTVKGEDDLSDRLAQDLLFFCANAKAPKPGTRLAAVRQAWGLETSLGVDYETARLGRFDPAWIAQARKRVASAKDAWSAVAGGELHRLPGLSEQFALVGDSLQRLFPSGDVLATSLQNAVTQTVAAAVAPPAPLAMEIATSILYLDASIEDGDLDHPELASRVQRLARRIDELRNGGDPQPLEGWMEELYRRVSDRQTMGSVVQELRSALSEVEKQIDQYFRDPSQRQVLIPVPNQLSAMRGVLSVLGMDQASQAVLHMRDDVDALAQTEVDPQRAVQAGTFDRLADNLGALSFLIDMLSVQPTLAKSLFHYDAATGSLSAVMGQSARISAFAAFDDTPLPAAQTPPLLDQAQSLALAAAQPEVPDAVVAEELSRLSRQAAAADQPALAQAMRSAQTALDDATDEGKRQAVRAELSQTMAGLAPPPPEAAPPAAPVPPSRAAAPGQTGLEDDVEMRDIFIEEAREVVANAQASLARLSEHPDDLGEMTALRRAFHTLKGSSRMVGLKDYGEAGWACEQLFNSRLAQSSRMDPDLRGFTTEALDYLHGWTEAIAASRDAGHSAEPVARAADALRLEGRRLPIEPPLLPATPLGLAVPAPAAVPAAPPAPPAPPAPADDGEDVLSLDFDLSPPSEATRAPALQPLQPLSSRVPDLPTAEDLNLDLDAPAIPAIAVDEAAAAAAPAAADQPVSFDLDLGSFDEAAPQALTPTAEVVELDLADFDFDFADATATPAAPAEPAGPGIEPEPAGEPAAELSALPEVDVEAAAEAQVLPEIERADLPTDFPIEMLAAPQAAAEPAAAAEAEPVPAEDEQVKVIGDLRISIPLFNIYLNEADEQSRRLGTELAEWAHEHERHPVSETAVALAHSLAGNSATVGYTDLSALARALEHALMRSQAEGRGRAGEPELFRDASEEIRRLLHQFAAGFQRKIEPGLMERLAEHERWPSLPPQAAEAGAPPTHAPLPTAAAHHEPEDDDIDAVDVIDGELFPIFEEEADELLPQLQSRLRDWIDHPNEADAPSACMRTLHTFKGGARLAGAMRLGEMAHRLETAIERLAAQDSVLAADIEPLLGRADNMASAFETLRKPGAQAPAAPAVPAAPVVPAPVGVPAPASAAAGVPAPVPEPAAPALADIGFDIGPATVAAAARAVPLPAVVAPQAAIDWSRFARDSDGAVQPTERAAPANSAAVRVRGSLLDRLVNQAGEVSITRARIDADVKVLQNSLNDLTESLERMRKQLRDLELQAETQMASRIEAAKAASASFDPLEMDRFTRFQELTRFMAESVNDVATLQRSLQRTLQSTEDQLAAQARLTRELQDDLLRTRMVEFESLADRLYRTVRQAAKETGKQVRLDIVGGGIEIDRGVLERMTGPFDHLLRNCVAHGIETPEQRAAAGKDKGGSITITITQEGNEVGVEVRDDGAGLNLARIRERGVERGLIAADAQTSNDELAQLIFAPGFSTAQSVTELAGRGVGLDVVRAEVNAMGGRVQTRSTPGQGTAFRLLLPLTTAVTQVVMLRCGELSIAVPSPLVQVVRRERSEIVEAAYASGHFRFNDEDLPFYWLAALLQAGTHGPTSGRTQPLVVINSASQRVVLHVDEIIGNQEVVVKNVGPQLSRLPGLAGVTLLPSGIVALIYNPVALATLYGPAARERMLQGPGVVSPDPVPMALPTLAPLVLVVDDSLTVRRVTQRLLVREGYRVTTAKDGLDALERLVEERPAVMLSDIEMPRMDGFDLVRNLRADPRFADLAVIMITSRIAQKHREYAEQLGVQHYLGKPYSEEELLSLVARYAGADILT
jgi:chemosensory pili system protein ChpA (sensor histidine kinase/response regulator)